MSLGAGLGRLAGRAFRIGHLGDFNELMLAGTLCGVEMGPGTGGHSASQRGSGSGPGISDRTGQSEITGGTRIMTPQSRQWDWRNRWAQLSFAVLSTVLLANMQYGWTLFVNPMHDANQWSRASIQVAFTILIFLNTWLSPVEGWLVDRYGPRLVVMTGGLCAGISWVANSRAETLFQLYISAVVGGVAIGCVFGTCMGTALKWFPDKPWTGGRNDRRRLRIGRRADFGAAGRA